ncbi:MAG: hypothetical protein HZC28_07320 [Spirochaetes bacterium]|nr:hypothetical protein [Spirochaetota bacterium]
MRLHCTHESARGRNYVPPPVGNGDISAMIDMQGIQRQTRHCGMIPGIRRAGRRYDTPLRELIPFGFIEQSTGEPVLWTQELDTARALITTDCTYRNGNEIRSEVFAHLDMPVIALRKTFKGPYTFSYILASPESTQLLPKRMQITSAITGHGIDISYTIAGLEPYNGIISLHCDRPAKIDVEGNIFRMTVADGPASFFIVFSDTRDDEDVRGFNRKTVDAVQKNGFDGLIKSHGTSWAEFWTAGHVALPDRLQQEVYETSLYHLRISATKWSIPVGIFDTHWHGRYFGFDEHFCHMGLLTSGHIDIARRVTEFRHRILNKAIQRSFSYFGESNADTGARYFWETDENGDECTPPGFWLEHIFNMANIALSAWNQYLYSGDIIYLAEKGYEVMLRCADFYLSQCVYSLGDGRLIVGKCTDLERLGAGRENAFMTSCGVIATFEAAAKAARILDRDQTKADRWDRTAAGLRESLPGDAGRYIPYPGCDKKSIAVLAGTFPYQCLQADDVRQTSAIDDFLANEKEFGNMYPVGNSVCVWYAAWKGLVFARLGKLDAARTCIAQAANEANCFSEIFEIRNPVHHPWFTTAEGSYVQLVNETLLQSAIGTIQILPQTGDCAFKLPAVGGVSVEAAFKNGVLQSLTLHARVDYSGSLTLPDNTAITLSLSAGSSQTII